MRKQVVRENMVINPAHFHRARLGCSGCIGFREINSSTKLRFRRGSLVKRTISNENEVRPLQWEQLLVLLPVSAPQRVGLMSVHKLLQAI